MQTSCCTESCAASGSPRGPWDAGPGPLLPGINSLAQATRKRPKCTSTSWPPKWLLQHFKNRSLPHFLGSPWQPQAFPFLRGQPSSSCSSAPASVDGRSWR